MSEHSGIWDDISEEEIKAMSNYELFMYSIGRYPATLEKKDE